MNDLDQMERLQLQHGQALDVLLALRQRNCADPAALAAAQAAYDAALGECQGAAAGLAAVLPRAARPEAIMTFEKNPLCAARKDTSWSPFEAAPAHQCDASAHRFRTREAAASWSQKEVERWGVPFDVYEFTQRRWRKVLSVPVPQRPSLADACADHRVDLV